MRPRKKKNGAQRFDNVKDYLLPILPDGTIEIDALVKEKEQLCIEFGCGKGTFICETAMRNPDCFFIAVERVRDVAILAMEKASEMKLENLRFYAGNVENILEILPHNSVDILYINFCDPWPKKRNAKRRLTFRVFLEKYKAFLKIGSEIRFKTDNIDLFTFSLDEFAAAGYRLEDVTYDLHSSSYADDNIMTEYERNFSQKGFKINRLVAHLDAK